MTARTPSPSAQFAVLLSRFSPETVALAKRCMPRIRRAVPCSYLIVYEYATSIVVAFGLSERGYEAIVALAIDARRVRLCFGAGKSLPDPQGRLEGSGNQMRSVTLEAAADLNHRDIQALFKAAIKHAGATFPKTRSIRMIFKAASKKPKAKPGRQR